MKKIICNKIKYKYSLKKFFQGIFIYLLFNYIFLYIYLNKDYLFIFSS